MKALLLALCCLALLALACGGADDDGGGSTAPPAAGGAAGAPDAGSPQFGAANFNDKLIVTSLIDLQVASLRDSYDVIARLAREAGGFVAEARLTDSGEEAGAAFLRLRVPAVRHDDLVADLRGLEGAEVKREESNAREVSAEYTDLESRLLNLQHTEAQYQQLLTRAGSIDEVLKVTTKLDSVRGDIEQVQGRISLIDDQAAYATISVRLALSPVVAKPGGGGLPSPVRVFAETMADSLVVAHALVNVGAVLLVAGLWLLPAGLVALVAWRRLRGPLQAFGRWLA